MCRLAYITRRFRGLKTWLAGMEKSQGGHGNGLAIADQVWRSVGLEVDSCVTIMQGSDQPALWHTRRTSSGATCDALCHPFACGRGWLVHNGHWSEGHDAAGIINDLGHKSPMSDTSVFAMLAARMGFIPACEKYEPWGVWLHTDYSGQLIVYKNGGSLHYCGGLQAWGSEPFYNRGSWYAVANGLYLPGEEPVREAAPANKSLASDLFRGVSLPAY